MSQPVKLSDTLVLDARITGEAQQRSIAGQVEFWARLGQSIEPLLQGRQVLKLRRQGKKMSLSGALATVDTVEGRKRVAEVLARRPFPHYEAHPTDSGLLVRIDKDGARISGRFVNKVFVESKINEEYGRVVPPVSILEVSSTLARPVKSKRSAVTRKV